MNLVVEPVIRTKKIQDPASIYQPSEKVKLRIKDIQDSMTIADDIRNRSYREFNDNTLLQRQDESQKAFNNYIVPIEDEDEQWRANTKNPKTRNRVISTVAHVTAQILAPVVQAQNENCIEDKEAAMIMKDLQEYVLEQVKYNRKFVYGMIAAAVNPAVIMEMGYLEVLRDFKKIISKDKWELKKELDTVFSGFFLNLVPVEELFIGDIYEHEIQKQPFLFRRRILDFSQAKIKYEDNPNFKKYVRSGVRIFFNDANNSFFEQTSEELENKVEELVYFNRLADLELVSINGVLMYEDVDRPMQRADKLYPFVKGGYELIDEGRFFYFRSLVEKLSVDQRMLDIVDNMLFDGSFLQAFTPLAQYGGEAKQSNVFIPGSINHFSGDSKLEAFLPQANLSSSFQMKQAVESSLSDSSQPPQSSGQSSPGDKTKYEVQRLEENARQILGLFGKMVGFLVEDLGELTQGSILQNMTFAEVGELVSDAMQLKYQSVLIPERIVNGKKMSRRIDFQMPDDQEQVLPNFQIDGLNQEEQLKLQQSAKIKHEEEKLGMSIAKVNPELFRKMKFKTKNSPDFLKPMSEEVIKALHLELYDRAIANPRANQETVLRDFLFKDYVPGEEDKYITKEQPTPSQPPPTPLQDPNTLINPSIKKVLNRRLQPAKV